MTGRMTLCSCRLASWRGDKPITFSSATLQPYEKNTLNTTRCISKMADGLTELCLLLIYVYMVSKATFTQLRHSQKLKSFPHSKKVSRLHDNVFKMIHVYTSAKTAKNAVLHMPGQYLMMLHSVPRLRSVCRETY